jgi:anion-transporting  ArsA/GET3 family ATPase
MSTSRVANSPVSELIERSRIVVCAGSGGVGKTTTAAALAVAAAQRGKNVLALTIDPAARLIKSLGLVDRPDVPTRVPLPRPAGADAEGANLATGNLYALIQDTKRTFDEMVQKNAPNPKVAAGILSNALYQQMSTRLAGVGEYMAVEKLLSLQRSGEYDLIVLDTPPTRNALEFLTAPQRLADALHSGAARFLAGAFAAPRDTQRGVLRRGMARALSGLGQITSSTFLQRFAALLQDLDELFKGLSERAQELSQLLTSDQVSYLVVSDPSELALEEARFFLDYLAKRGSSSSLLVVNRVRSVLEGHPVEASAPQLVAELERLGVTLADDAANRVARVLLQEQRTARRDQAGLKTAQSFGRPVLLVPEQTDPVHDLPGLVRLAQVFA